MEILVKQSISPNKFLTRTFNGKDNDISDWMINLGLMCDVYRNASEIIFAGYKDGHHFCITAVNVDGKELSEDDVEHMWDVAEGPENIGIRMADYEFV